jgi:hypothetical protein
MWANRAVIEQHIDREIDHLGDQCSAKALLASQAKRYFRGEITFDEAHLEFASHPPAITLLKQLQQVLDMTNHPLPAFRESLSSNQSRRRPVGWTTAEDLRLLAAVARIGAKDWRWISAFVGAGRTPGQCNQRWSRTINPAISHGPWEDEEDQKLLTAVKTFGHANWCQIAKTLPGRTDLQCRYHYRQLTRRMQIAESVDVPSPNSPEDRQDPKSMTAVTEMDALPPARPPPMLPYYLEASLTPRENPSNECLHRVPPLLFARNVNSA